MKLGEFIAHSHLFGRANLKTWLKKGFSRISVMVIITVAIYILPALLAWKRQSSRRWRITLISLLLGWTFVGWIVAMVMTFSYEPPPEGAAPDEPHLR